MSTAPAASQRLTARSCPAGTGGGSSIQSSRQGPRQWHDNACEHARTCASGRGRRAPPRLVVVAQRRSPRGRGGVLVICTGGEGGSWSPTGTQITAHTEHTSRKARRCQKISSGRQGHVVQCSASTAPYPVPAAASWRPPPPARPFPSSIFLDKNRRDIGKSQSRWKRPAHPVHHTALNKGVTSST
jgi:hypothetical protein